MSVLSYDVGDVVRMRAVFTVAGVATDPTTVTFKLRLPDGTTQTKVYGTDVEVVKSATGDYKWEYAPLTEGIYRWRAVGTGAAAAAGDGAFNVVESVFV